MVNWFVQTIRIFAWFSVQTIRTLTFIFVSAVLIIVPNLKEIYPGESSFSWLKVIVVNWCKDKKFS